MRVFWDVTWHDDKTGSHQQKKLCHKPQDGDTKYHSPVQDHWFTLLPHRTWTQTTPHSMLHLHHLKHPCSNCWLSSPLILTLKLLICSNARQNSMTNCFTMAWLCAPLFILSTSYFPCYRYTTHDICPTRYKGMTLLNCRCFSDAVHAIFMTYFLVPYTTRYKVHTIINYLQANISTLITDKRK